MSEHKPAGPPDLPQPDLSQTDRLDSKILELLHPEIVLDADGFERSVYSFGEKRVVFKGREECPTIPGFEEAYIAGGSERPRFGQQELEVSQNPDPTKIIANQTPLGVVETAIAFGIGGDKMTELREELSVGTYSKDALDLIDDIVACQTMAEHGQPAEVLDFNAEAIVLLALQGNELATQTVRARREALESHYDTQRKRMFKGSPEKINGEILDANQALLVRRTKTKPEFDDQGRVAISAASDVLDWKLPRASVHFTVNEVVQSHLSGNWDELPYTVVAALGDTMDASGRTPANMEPSDTWFYLNPGEKLLLPGARVFEADTKHIGPPKQEQGITKYNPGESDINELVLKEMEARGIRDFDSYNRLSDQYHNLARQIGSTYSQYHQEFPENRLEKTVLDALARATRRAAGSFDEMISGEVDFDWRLFGLQVQEVEAGTREHAASVVNWRFGPDSLTNSPPEARRALYASGLMVPRDAYVIKDELSGIGIDS